MGFSLSFREFLVVAVIGAATAVGTASSNENGQGNRSEKSVHEGRPASSFSNRNNPNTSPAESGTRILKKGKASKKKKSRVKTACKSSKKSKSNKGIKAVRDHLGCEGPYDAIPSSSPISGLVSTCLGSLTPGDCPFGLPIGCWNTTLVTDMTSAFRDKSNFNAPLGWDVRNVQSMRRMFEGALAFNQPLEKWNTCAVTDMKGMFEGAKDFNQPLQKWEVGSVEDMSSMFSGAEAFNQPLQKWDAMVVGDMSEMFKDALAFDQCLSSWANKIPNDPSRTTDVSDIFLDSGCSDTGQPPDDPFMPSDPWCGC